MKLNVILILPLSTIAQLSGEVDPNASQVSQCRVSQMWVQDQHLQEDSKKQVYVRGDKNAQYGQVVEAMVLLQKAGVSSVGLVTDDQPQ